MRDYAELISDLRRHHCDAKEDDTQEVCEECAYDVIVSDKSKFNGITDVCTCGLMHRAADAIEELQRLKTTGTIYGYPVNELIAFATACRENDVDEKDLKTFANNARFAFEIVHAETEAAFQRAIHGVGGTGVE